MDIKQTLGVTTTSKFGEVYFIVSLIATIAVIVDILNFSDPVGYVKKTLHNILPSLFKADKFRPDASETKA